MRNKELKVVFNGISGNISVVYCNTFREVMETVGGFDIFNNLSIWNCDSIEIYIRNSDDRRKWDKLHKLTNTRNF